MVPDVLQELLRSQDGVVSRGQVLALGLGPHDLRRLVRNRHLTPMFPGIFVGHTGEPSWLQRAWAAVLAVGGGALCGESALRAAGGPGRRGHPDGGLIHVAVDRMRSVTAPAGVVVHRRAGLAERVLWNANPPRMRVEEALLDVAAAARSDFAAVAPLADAVQARLTTAERLLETLAARERIARRPLLASALTDIAEGTCSVLEREYLVRVERPHGLPRPWRQARGAVERPTIRDLDYPRYGLVIELDGRLFHDTARARDADLARDLEAAVAERRLTVRLGWGQVVDRPCLTARHVGALLRRQGWAGELRSCPLCGGSESPGDPNPPRKR